MGAYLLIVVAVMSRVLPHPWLNFTAVGGGLLYFGARRPLREAIWPVLALMATDFYLTMFFYHYAWHTSAYLVTWAWYVGAILLGRVMLGKQVTVPRVLGAPVIASTSFFLVSNFVAWIALYPHTGAGLTACYALALPFYRNDLLSTTLVTGLAFGLPMVARDWASRRTRFAQP
ncbi:MAG TPA: DUF6580 family putative transport protein [Acidobacteriaceae bacterium]|jgi:hypothetical protein|nr:DUF6580 family putative transport protein [Acidobacteriaceae bacterium]